MVYFWCIAFVILAIILVVVFIHFDSVVSDAKLYEARWEALSERYARLDRDWKADRNELKRVQHTAQLALEQHGDMKKDFDVCRSAGMMSERAACEYGTKLNEALAEQQRLIEYVHGLEDQLSVSRELNGKLAADLEQARMEVNIHKENQHKLMDDVEAVKVSLLGLRRRTYDTLVNSVLPTLNELATDIYEMSPKGGL